jgi:lysophospholipase L1-like esterase
MCKYLDPGRTFLLGIVILIILATWFYKIRTEDDRRATLRAKRLAEKTLLPTATLMGETREVGTQVSNSGTTSGSSSTGDSSNDNTNQIGSSSGPPKLELLDDDRTLLCFGDSLTHGTDRPHSVHPYALHLSELLKRPVVQGNGHGSLQTDNVPLGAVVENGWPGELTGSMVNRLPNALKTAHNPGLVVILGGTNDIGQGVDAERIVQNLIQLHETSLHSASLQTGLVHTIHMTVPPAGAYFLEKNTRYEEKRKHINTEMRKHIALHNKDPRVVDGDIGAILLVDLEYVFCSASVLPFFSCLDLSFPLSRSITACLPTFSDTT